MRVQKKENQHHHGLLGTALLLSAAAGMIYEVVATHILLFYFVRSSYSIALVLSIFLAGLGIGSYLVYRFKTKNDALLFGTAQFLLGCIGFVILLQIESFVHALSTFGLFLTTIVVLLPTAILLGAAFPLAVHIFEKKQRRVVGFVYAVDLVGAVLGTLLAGFFLIPVLGNTVSLIIAASINVVAGMLLFKNLWVKVVAVLFVCLAIVFFLPQKSDVDFRQQSAFGEVVVYDGRLYIDSREQCSLSYLPSTGERLIVNYTMRTLPRSAKTINIGLGCGLTAKELLSQLDAPIDIVEINPAVVAADKELSRVLGDPRINLILDEGLSYLRKNKQTYDAVIMDIEEPAVVHSSDLYTSEAFLTIRESLKDNGVFGVWINPCTSDEYYDIMYNTLHTVFPYVAKPGDDFFIASIYDLGLVPYSKRTSEQRINTLDRKLLSSIYFEQCKWWPDNRSDHIMKFN